MIKLGTDYGGWYIPENVLNEKSICYCVGCGEDITFDLELIKKYNCTVVGIDPTPRAITHVNENTKEIENYIFEPVGLWDEKTTLKFYEPKNKEHVSHSFLNLQKTEEYIEVEVDTLLNIMNKYNHNKLDLIKIDIEGSEYRVLNYILENNIDIDTICVEFDEMHNPFDYSFKDRIEKYITLLTNNKYKLLKQDRANFTFMKTNEINTP